MRDEHLNNFDLSTVSVWDLSFTKNVLDREVIIISLMFRQVSV